MEPEHDENEKRDQDYKPHGIPSRQAIKPPQEKYSRRSKRYAPGDASDSDILVIPYECIELFAVFWSIAFRV
jgi:hypothetical protein